MSERLKYRQQKIQERRKQTPWREFVMEVASWLPVSLSSSRGFVTKYPDTDRIGTVVPLDQFSFNDGDAIDASGDFFGSFQDVFLRATFPSLTSYGGAENSDFADITHNTKNAYLTFNSVWGNENILYSMCIKDNCTNVYSSFMVWDSSENIFFSKCVLQSSMIFYSKFVYNCAYLYLCSNCIGCTECINCHNLENKQYCINNKQFSKEEYLVQKEKVLDKYRRDFESFYSEKLPQYGADINSTACTGSFNINGNDIENGYMTYDTSDARNIVVSGSNKGNTHIYDNMMGGSGYSSHFYATCASGTAEHLYCCEGCGLNASNMYYSINCQSSSFLLGCVGLQNKSYCIFNKQYEKDERYQKVDEIFGKMEADGALGQFFPGWMNPFYFNDTAAHLIDDTFTKEEIIAKGYLRRDEPIKVDIPEGTTVIKTSDLVQYEGFDEGGKWSIDPEILKVIIQDEQGNVYRIVQMEYDFLMKHGLPLPRKHRLERMRENFSIT